MTWNNVALISTTEEWQYTEIFEGDYIRLRHILGASTEDLPYGFVGLIAQAFDFSNSPELYNIRKLYPYNEEDIFPVVNPFPDRSRRLAVRGQKKYKTRINWRVAIDVWHGETRSIANSECEKLSNILERLERLPVIEQKLDELLSKQNPEAIADYEASEFNSLYFYGIL